MKIELNAQEVRTLIIWFEEATKGKFGLGDDTSPLSWEDEVLLKKLRDALEKLK